MSDARFRIDLTHDRLGWEAKVYDLADHGPDTFYAGASSKSLDVVLHEAAHYVFVASQDANPRAAV